MGIPDLWQLTPSKTMTLLQFAADFHAQHRRAPVVAIDMFIMMYEVLDGCKSTGYAIFHRQFIRRIKGFVANGIIIVGVFDGTNKQQKMRNTSKVLNIRYDRVLAAMQDILRSLGLVFVEADSEGEAQVAILQRQGFVDYAFTGDSDVLAYGATRALRYTKGDKATARQVQVVQVDEKAHWMFVMYATLAGHDWGKGVPGLGTERAKALVSIPSLVELFEQWYLGTVGVDELVAGIEEELHFKKSGKLKTGWSKKRHIDPSTFDRDITAIWAEPLGKKVDWYTASWDLPNYSELARIWRGRSPIFDKSLVVPSKGKGTRATADTEDAFWGVVWSIWLTWTLVHDDRLPDIVQRIVTKKPIAGQLFKIVLAKSALQYLNVPVPSMVTVPYHLIPGIKPVRQLRFDSVSKEQMIEQAWSGRVAAAPAPVSLLSDATDDDLTLAPSSPPEPALVLSTPPIRVTSLPLKKPRAGAPRAQMPLTAFWQRRN